VRSYSQSLPTRQYFFCAFFYCLDFSFQATNLSYFFILSSGDDFNKTTLAGLNDQFAGKGSLKLSGNNLLAVQRNRPLLDHPSPFDLTSPASVNSRQVYTASMI